jgi:hypothetical protein
MSKGMYSSKPDESFDKKSEVLKEQAQSKLDILQRGSVTEITLGNRKFQISDPAKLERVAMILKGHEDMLSTMRNRIKEQHNAISVLISEVQTLKNEVQRLKEITNGYGSQEYSGY